MEIPLTVAIVAGAIIFMNASVERAYRLAASAFTVSVLSVVLLILISVFGVFGKWEEHRSSITTHFITNTCGEVTFSSPMLVEYIKFGNRLSLVINHKWNVWKVTPEIPFSTATPTYTPDIVITN